MVPETRKQAAGAEHSEPPLTRHMHNPETQETERTNWTWGEAMVSQRLSVPRCRLQLARLRHLSWQCQIPEPMGDTFIQTATVMVSTVYFNIVRVCVDDNLNGGCVHTLISWIVWMSNQCSSWMQCRGWHRFRTTGEPTYYLDGMTTLIQVCMYRGKPLLHGALPRDSDRVWDKTRECESVPALQLILWGLFWRNTGLADLSGHFQIVTQCVMMRAELLRWVYSQIRNLHEVLTCNKYKSQRFSI